MTPKQSAAAHQQRPPTLYAAPKRNTVHQGRPLGRKSQGFMPVLYTETGVQHPMPKEAVEAVLERLQALMALAPFKPEAVPDVLHHEALNIVRAVRKADKAPLTPCEAEDFCKWLEERLAKQSTHDSMDPIVRKVIEMLKE